MVIDINNGIMISKSIKRCFSTTLRLRKIVPSNVKGSSSNYWITRQQNDPYVEKAKMLNYRCRSAFKLIEMDDKYHFLQPGHAVVDLGAAPGSWTQVAVSRVNANCLDPKKLVGKVVAVDKQQVYPIEGAIICGNSDITSETTQEKVMEALLPLHKANVILSDMAPAASGVKYLDNENMIHLCYIALQFAVKMSVLDATFVVKLWQCGETKTLENNISRFYKSVRIVKPNASRSDSAEIYFLARNFRGLKTDYQ